VTVEPPRARRPRLGIVVACAAHFLVGADGLAVATALPTLQADLHVAPIEAQWVLTAYGLAFGGTLTLGGRLGDLFGRRRLLVSGMALFATGALVAAAAPTLQVLVAARALQGLGGAAAVPATLALIGSMVPPGPRRARALSMLAATASLGIMSGMLAGGVLTELLGWRWVFWLMTPFAAVAAAVAPRVLPETGPVQARSRLDVGGAVLLTGALVATLFGLTRLEHAEATWASTTVPMLCGLALLGAFTAWERRSAAPLVPLDVLRVPSLRAAALGVGGNSIAFTSIVYVGTLYLQGALGYSPGAAGLALLPTTVVACAVSLVIGGRVSRHSPRALLVASFAATATALLWLARAPSPANYVTDVMAPLVVLGVSLPVAFVVLTQEAVADVAGDDKGIAAGVFETANHLFGGAVGVAVYATVLSAAAGSGDPTSHGAGFLAAAAFTPLGFLAALLVRGRERSPAEGRADAAATHPPTR
jgi:MFS family permease